MSCGFKNAAATALCIVSPAPLIFLAGLQENGFMGEKLAGWLGLLLLFIMIAAAVAVFIMTDGVMKRYEFIKEGEFRLMPGIADGLREARESLSPTAPKTALGVVMCIFCPVPLIVAGLLEAPVYILAGFVSLLLAIVAAAVFIFVSSGSEDEAYEMLLKTGEYSPTKTEGRRRARRVESVYWSVVTAAYLLFSFVTHRWGISWVIWPVAAVLSGAVSAWCMRE